MAVFPVILAGGSGSRLWPMSGEDVPKQFLKLFGERSLFQNTVLRMEGFCDPSLVKTVCGESQRTQIEADLSEVDLPTQGHVIAEPSARNTAPAVLLGVQQLASEADDPILIILPADHHIENVAAFHDCLKRAVACAQEGAIVTLGIRPTGPETGYGYIEAGEEEGTGGSHPVARFVEKPDLATAEGYLASGRFLWNSGMFIFKASVMNEEFARYQPEIVKQVTAFLDGDREAYDSAPRISIDYAIMEQTEKARVVPADFGWSDLGTWTSVHLNSEKDQQGNTLRGEILTTNCSNSYIRAESRTVAVLGLSDVVVVETENAVLVSASDHAQEVSNIYKQALALQGEPEEWGSVKVIAQDRSFRTCRLTLNPDVSYQPEPGTTHWVVVSGVAVVEYEDSDTAYGVGSFFDNSRVDSIDNPSDDILELIETRC